MSDEKPVPIKKYKKAADSELDCLTCIVHYTKRTEDKELKRLSDTSFASVRHALKVRQSHSNESVRLD